MLSHAESIGDILSVRDRITAVQSEIDQLQGKINLLGDQASFSSVAVSLTEKPVHPKPAAAQHAPKTGLAKSWADARSGFAKSVEWLIARSGAALIVLLAGLLLAFALRYLSRSSVSRADVTASVAGREGLRAGDAGRGALEL